MEIDYIILLLDSNRPLDGRNKDLNKSNIIYSNLCADCFRFI